MAKWSDVLGAGVSGLGGAASGAAVGTALGGPGLGTGIGAGIGAIAGIGASAADTIQNKKLEQAAERQQEALRKALRNTGVDLGAYVNSVNMGSAEQTRQLVSRTGDASVAMGLAPTQSIAAMQDARRRGDMAAFEKSSEAVRTAAVIDAQRKDAILRQFGTSQELANSAMQGQSNIAQNFGAIAGSAALAAGIMSGPKYEPAPYKLGAPKLDNGPAQIDAGSMPSQPTTQADAGGRAGRGGGAGRDAYAFRSGSSEPWDTKDVNNIFGRAGVGGPGMPNGSTGQTAPSVVPTTGGEAQASPVGQAADQSGQAANQSGPVSVFDDFVLKGGVVDNAKTMAAESAFYKEFPNLLTGNVVNINGKEMNVAQAWAELGVDYTGNKQLLVAEADLFKGGAAFSTAVDHHIPEYVGAASGVFLDPKSYDAMNEEIGINKVLQTDGYTARKTRYGDIIIYGRGTGQTYVMPGPGPQ